ncbi:MAG: phage major capsid protein [Desulfuromonadaceae bacterium]|nr:phage major capsid protein [Desulfuromonadaceae bacterium]MDD2856278.1 phage major capsid protein [Desulfuromonadaceae bacterium]
MQTQTLKTGTMFRSFGINRAAINVESRSIEISFSSEAPVERWFGTEILDHAPGSVRLDRIKTGGPLLMDHCRDDQVGVVEDVAITADRKGRAIVRFGKSVDAEEIYQDVLDGIRQNVSVGYVIHKMEVEEPEGMNPVYRATDWEPLEISIVSVPADISVGVGRSADETAHETAIICRNLPKKEIQKMETQTVDLQAVRTEERNKELARVRDIIAIGSRQKLDDLARQFVENGKGVDEFRSAVIEAMEARGEIKKVTTTAEIGMGERDVKEYSLLRAINAMANPNDRKAQEAAAFEFETSRAVADGLKRSPQGFFIPAEVQKRDLVVGTTTAGGFTKQTTVLGGSFIDLLRNRMMVNKMGATTLTGLVGDIAIPSLSGGATAYWVAENGAPTESQQTFGQVALAPKTVGAFTDISRKLLLQSSVDVESLVTMDLANVVAHALDLAALHGTGSGNNQPTGIAGTSGIGSVAGGTDGAAPTFANMISLWSEVAIDNADFGSLGFLTNSKVIGKLMSTLKVPTYGNDFIVNAFPDAEGITNIHGSRCGVSNQVSSALTKGGSGAVASAIFFGNWSDLIIGQWGGVDVLVDPYTGGAAGTVRVRVLQDADVAVRHASSFSAMLDALTA